MRRALIGLVIAGSLCQPVLAQSNAQQLLPSPVGVVITVGTWVVSANNRKLFEVEVQSQGATFDQAKAEGYRLAVEHAVGSLILSETEVRNNRMQRDEIITYASGYVDKFEILDRRVSADRVTVRMKVWVAHSKLANRLLNESKASGEVEGERVNAQVQTFKQQRQSGDRVLNAVLADYPQRAYDIQVLPTRVEVDRNRTPYLFVQFNVQWNSVYLASLEETLAVINQRNNCKSWANNCQHLSTVQIAKSGFASDAYAWFDDDMAWNIVHTQMIRSMPQFQVTIRNAGNRVIFQQCMSAPELDHNSYSPWQFVEIGPQRVRINSWRWKRFQAYLDISALPIQQFEQVEVRAVRGNQC